MTTTASTETTRLEGLPVEVTLSPATLPLLPAALGEHVPRIVREALHNTVKHAAARQVRPHAIRRLRKELRLSYHLASQPPSTGTMAPCM